MKKIILVVTVAVTFFSCKKTEQNKNTTAQNSPEVVTTLKNDGSSASKETINLKNIENKIISFINTSNYAEAFKLLKETISNYPNKTFTYPFQELEEKNIIKIITTRNNKLRYYTWNDKSGGTWKNYDGIYQTNINGNITSTKLPKNTAEHSNLFVQNIHTIENGKHAFYIIKSIRVYANNNVSQTAKAYKIENNDLTPVELFKTSKKSYSEITVKYDPTKSNTTNNILIDETSVKFRVINNNNSTTKNFLNYLWKDNHFQYDGVIDPSSPKFMGELGTKLLQTESFGGVTIGLTTNSVIQKLGQPNKSSKGEYSDAIGAYQGNMEYSNKGIFLGTSGKKQDKQTVDYISIKAPCTLKTNKNIGIGSTVAECIEAYLPHLNPYDFKGSELNLGDGIMGMKIYFTNKKVTTIALGTFGE